MGEVFFMFHEMQTNMMRERGEKYLIMKFSKNGMRVGNPALCKPFPLQG